LLKSHGIGLIVFTDRGGAGARAKIEAVRLVGLAVLMRRRPPLLNNNVRVTTASAAREWLRGITP
jgi:precorrin-6A/cobalt-precorrin-6A reductase